MRRPRVDLDVLITRLASSARVPDIEETGCVLPADQRCVGGWHVKADGGAGIAYARCPRAMEARAEERAAGIPGEQTFETFEKVHEMEAFLSARLWTECCLKGEPAKLALIRGESQQSNTGCGKTHLLRAAARELTRAGKWVEIVTSQSLTSVVRGRALYEQIERGNAEVEAKKWSSSEVLILDDLGLEETSGPITGSFLVGVLDARGDASQAFATNQSERELTSRYGAALVSRLLGGAHAPPLAGNDFRRGTRRRQS